MSKTIGYAVVGLGVGRHHVRGAVNAEGCRLVAICDIRPERFDAIRDPMVGPVEATKAVKIINAVYESARSGKEVIFKKIT